MEKALAIVYPEVPSHELKNLRDIIDYFAKKGKTVEEATRKARDYVIDRVFFSGWGKVNPTPAFDEAVKKKFNELH
jgi:hypothetical protein